MTNYELKNIDSEDIEGLLKKVETSFNIKFVSNELVHITTFGQLCDHIANKIQLDDSDNCTNQQAFYKLRSAISTTLQIDPKTILVNSTLTTIFPRQSRRSKTKKLEKHLGFKLNILRPPHWVTTIFIILFFASVVELFFNRQIALLGFVFLTTGIWLANRIGNELDLQTVGQVAEKMTRENYLKSRRNPKTFNKKEIEKVLTDWFSKDFHIEKSNLTRESKFV